jgi:hypothetical protein
VRTFEYEFADEGSDYFGTCGLMNFDLTPKPAYNALSAVIHLLSDPGAAFTPVRLSYTLSGQTNNVHHLLLQKRDGTYYLALWIETPSWNANTDALIPVPAQSISVSLPAVPVLPEFSTLDDTGAMTTVPLVPVVNVLNVSLTDRVSVISVRIP